MGKIIRKTESFIKTHHPAIISNLNDVRVRSVETCNNGKPFNKKIFRNYEKLSANLNGVITTNYEVAFVWYPDHIINAGIVVFSDPILRYFSSFAKMTKDTGRGKTTIFLEVPLGR